MLILVMGIQAISAESDSQLDDSIGSDDSNEKISVESDFQTPSEVNVNSSKKVEINFNSTESVLKSDLTLKLNKSNVVSDINDFEVSNSKIKFDLVDDDFTQAILNIAYKNTNSHIVLKHIVNVKIEAVTLTSEYQVGKFTFKVTDMDTGDAVVGKNLNAKYRIRGMFDISQDQIMTTDSQGIATFYLNKVSNPNYKSGNLQIGDYNMTITGKDQLKGELQTTVTVQKAEVVITPVKYSEIQGSGKNFTVKLTSKTTGEAIKYGELVLNIPGTADIYYRITTSKDGIGSISVSRLGIGEYPLTVTTNDTNLNNASATGKISITKVKVKINVKSVTKYFNSGPTTVIKITDSNGKALKGVTVQIIVDKKSYIYTTNSKGQVTLLTSVNVGKHKMVVNVVGNKYTANSVTKTLKVKKATGKLKASNKKYYYKSGKYLTVKLINTKNKKGIFNAKIHFKVRISKTKISNLYGTTQKDGKIKLNRDLKPGKYQITVKGKDSKNFKTKTLKIKLTVKKRR